MKTTSATKTCPRCGGTGNYLFNQIHGTMCYGCNGKGVVSASAHVKATVRRDDCMRYIELQNWVGRIKFPWRKTQYESYQYLTLERVELMPDRVWVKLHFDGGKQSSHKASDVFFPVGTNENGERIDLRTGDLWKWDMFGNVVAA